AASGPRISRGRESREPILPRSSIRSYLGSNIKSTNSSRIPRAVGPILSRAAPALAARVGGRTRRAVGAVAVAPGRAPPSLGLAAPPLLLEVGATVVGDLPAVPTGVVPGGRQVEPGQHKQEEGQHDDGDPEIHKDLVRLAVGARADPGADGDAHRDQAHD